MRRVEARCWGAVFNSRCGGLADWIGRRAGQWRLKNAWSGQKALKYENYPLVMDTTDTLALGSTDI